MGHPKLYSFAFRVSKVKLLFSVLLNITQHPGSISLFSDHKAFLSMSTQLFLDNDTTGLYNTSVLPQQTCQAGFNYLNAWPEKMHQWEQLGYICAVLYPAP